jgi:hypothetical protein
LRTFAIRAADGSHASPRNRYSSKRPASFGTCSSAASFS